MARNNHLFMANPRIFVSSTYYDLKHLRSSLENFVERLGYEPILSEKGDIAYTPDIPLDESCYREVQNADIFVLIVGGRYGSEASGKKKRVTSDFFEHYDSITKKELKSAMAEDIPVYILIEANVYSEYQTFLKNKDSRSVVYAHVDSVNIFHLIEEILCQPKNNPFKTFERYSDIEKWLQEQWAGLFKELLKRMTGQRQIAALSAQVLELSEVSKTLRTYMEAVVAKISPEQSAKLIGAEQERLSQVRGINKILNNPLIEYLQRKLQIADDALFEAVSTASDISSFLQVLKRHGASDENLVGIRNLLTISEKPLKDLNLARGTINLPVLQFDEWNK